MIRMCLRIDGTLPELHLLGAEREGGEGHLMVVVY